MNRMSLTFTALAGALTFAAACNPTVVSPISTGGSTGSSPSSGPGDGFGGQGVATLTDLGPGVEILSIAAGNYNVFFSTPETPVLSNVMLWQVAYAGGSATPLATQVQTPCVFVDLVTDALNLYWVDFQADSSYQQILAKPQSGGDLWQIEGVMDGSKYGPHGFAKAMKSLYWAQPGEILKAGDVGTDTDGTFVAGSKELIAPTVVAADTVNVYVYDAPSEAIYAAPLSGGPVEKIATDTSANVQGLAAAGGFVYWPTATSPGGIAQVPAGGGAVQIFADTHNPKFLGHDATDLYWTDDEGVQKMPLGGGAVTLLATFDAPASWGQVTAFAVGPTHVYWGYEKEGAIVQHLKAN